MNLEKHVNLRRSLDVFVRLLAAMGFVGILLVSATTVLDVALRWLWSAPIEGFGDYTPLLFAVIVAAFLPVGLLRGHNVTIRFLGSWAGLRPGRWLEAFGAVVTLGFFALLAWQCVRFAEDQRVSGSYTLIVKMPTAPWWWAVAALLMAGVAIQVATAAARVRDAVVLADYDDLDAPSDGAERGGQRGGGAGEADAGEGGPWIR